MVQDVIGNWVTKAKSAAEDAQKADGVKVIRRQESAGRTKSKGEIIMEMADKMWPSLMKLFADVRDENGVLMQPAHVRGIALNVAQDLVQNKEANKNS